MTAANHDPIPLDPGPWSFTVDGEPQGKGRPITGRNKATGGVLVRTPTKTRRYEEAVAMSARPFLPRKIAGDLKVGIVAVFKRPLRLKSTETMVPAGVRPDADNIAKAQLDGLKSHFEDARVTTLTITKRYADPHEKPHVLVAIERIGGAKP